MNADVKTEQQAIQAAGMGESLPALRMESLPAVAGPVAGPLANAIAALRSGMTVQDMRALMDLQLDWEQNEARKAYVADMAEFKRNAPEIVKDKLVSFNDTSYMHASLGQVVEKIVAGLAQHGFSHRWDMDQQDGQVIVTCTITHRLGHCENTTLKTSPDTSGKKNHIQAVSSAVAYLQRYTLLAGTGLATKDLPDDDGRGYKDESTYNSDATVATWTETANGAASLERLSEVRKEAGKVFNAAKDVDGWTAIKGVIEKRKNELQPAAKEGAK